MPPFIIHLDDDCKETCLWDDFVNIIMPYSPNKLNL